MSRTRERKRIAKDPFHQQILEALGRHLDPQIFEACMADLLRDVFPGLVPVPGGNDAGMDGAIADGKGEPYPLVCTTGEDVARNLRNSLGAFLDRGLPSRKVALATSRTLTPPETRALFLLAEKKEFKLLQVFERSALAALLYRNSIWCKRLLGLSGTPSALSVVPLSRRPQINIELKGRDEDVAWLRSTTGDRVVLGFPGSGKTYLFSSLIRSGWPALFLVNGDDAAIANAIRDQKPGIVIVDDAHVAPEKLDRLKRLRDEIQGEFEIVAASWPGARADVIEAMGGLPESRIHNLGLLTRAQILEIYYALGVRPRDEILRDLVSQAGNKPGLAVTIALLWRQGEWQKILDGSVLSRTLLALFKGLTGGDVADVLAVFSLGGRRGMSLEAVAGFLQIPSRDVWRIATDLAAGGVLSEVDTERLAVNPQVLRFALLRQIFFTGSPIRLDYRKLLPLVPSFAESVGEIMAARAYGAVIPTDDLHDLVLRFGSRQAWSTLAMMSEEEARWVLENYPGDIMEVGRSLLRSESPAAAVRRYLESATSATGAIHSQPDHPMRILSDWVRDLDIPIDQMILRRRILAASSKKYIAEGGEPAVGVHWISLALSPSLEGSSLDPGAGRTVTISSGILSIPQLREIGEIWEDARSAIHSLGAASWAHLSAALWDWIYPDYSAPGTEVDEECREVMRAFAAKVLGDLVPLAENSPGLVAGLKDLAEKVDLDLPLQQDTDFETLYPAAAESAVDFERQEAIRQVAIKNLAVKWAAESPVEIAKKVVRYEEEARRIKRTWPRGTPGLCGDLALLVATPEAWLDALIQVEAPADLVEPFLRIILDRHGAEQILAQSLNSERYVWLATGIILQSPNPPSHLLEVALERVAQFPQLVETLCLRKQVPLPNLRALLEHRAWEVALAAAVGEWLSDPKGAVRTEIADSWRDAILRAQPDEHSGTRFWLGEIFAEKPDVAFDWLRTRLADKDRKGPFFLSDRGPFAKAASVLSRDQRIVVLGELSENKFPPLLISLLVQKEPDVYRKLLESTALSRFHLSPLAYIPDTEWADLAMLAVAARHDPQSIAERALFPVGESVSWSSESRHWSQFDEAFLGLEADPREKIREIARRGRRKVQDLIQRAKDKERLEEVRGY